MAENFPPYKWLWSRTTGKPYTWIIRAAQAAKPFFFIAGAFVLGLICGLIKLRGFWIGVLVGLALGAFMAHVWKW